MIPSARSIDSRGTRTRNAAGIAQVFPPNWSARAFSKHLAATIRHQMARLLVWDHGNLIFGQALGRDLRPEFLIQLVLPLRRRLQRIHPARAAAG
jgi:hypothetical protein